MSPKVVFDLPQILELLPHRDPFLFVDAITKFKANKKIVATRYLRPDEPHFKGHFPQKPIMPGVLITDALAQTSGLLWGFSKKVDESTPDETNQTIFFLASDEIKFVKPALPGQTLTLESTLIESFGSFYKYKVEAYVERTLICKGKLTLAIQPEDAL